MINMVHTSQDNQNGFNTNHFRDPFDMFRTHFFHESHSGAEENYSCKVVFLSFMNLI